MSDLQENKIELKSADYVRLKIMLEAGVFKLDNGKIEINCHNGQIQSIHVHKLTYKRKAESGKIPI